SDRSWIQRHRLIPTGMERRPPSKSRARIPAGYGNYPGRDPDSPVSQQQQQPATGGGGGGGGRAGMRKKRAKAPWGGLFAGELSHTPAGRPTETLPPQRLSLPRTRVHPSQEDIALPTAPWSAGTAHPDDRSDEPYPSP
ncbi:unnamed protein product, partial [Scytosiphon promiscuus]